MKYLNRFFFALTFLTRLPLPVKVKYNDKITGKSMLFYPLVGIIIGCIIALIDRYILVFFPAGVKNVLVVIGFIYISGGLHLDGFIDTMDGIFSGRKTSRILEIMHDSQVGAFGVIALILLILLKLHILINLSGIYRIPLLIFMPACSRYLMVFTMKYFPLAESSKLGKDFKKSLSWKEITGGLSWLILLIFLLKIYTGFSPVLFIIIFILSFLVTILFGYYIKSRIQGITGDVVGAVNEIVEVFVIMVALIII
ncbi:MAG: adenosylcobinamide-GDP ribazoletransferase [Bacillota bacterium]